VSDGSSMDHLYTPWRMTYLAEEKGNYVDCVFCAKAHYVDEATEQAEWIVARSQFVFVTLNKFPYNNGHLMVVPRQHGADLAGLPKEAHQELAEMLRVALRLLGKAYPADGYNLGMNLGKAAGAGVAGHIHMHILPRWFADVNFMTSVAETRVLPEDLPTTYKRIRSKF